MPITQLVINDELGLHARPATALVKLSRKYRSRITLQKDGRTADCKSILQVLTLAAPAGSTLVLTAEGEDAVQAMSDLSSLKKDGIELKQ